MRSPDELSTGPRGTSKHDTTMKHIHAHHIHIILLAGIFILGLVLITANIQTEVAYQSKKQLIGVSKNESQIKK